MIGIIKNAYNAYNFRKRQNGGIRVCEEQQTFFCISALSTCDQGNPGGNLFSNFSKTNIVITHFLSYFYTCTGYYYNRFFFKNKEKVRNTYIYSML